MLLIVMQWICHCVRLQIDSVGVFVWALAPFLGFWFVFGCLLRCFRWRNASLAGGFAGRRFGVVVFFVLLFYRFAYSKDFFVLVQSFVCLLTCKDRAISATSATLEEKKSHSNNKQMCHRTYRDLRARQTWMQVVR